MRNRVAVFERNTNETQVKVEVNLDGDGHVELQTSIPFFDHMLEQIAFHGNINLKIIAKGDIDVDFHHAVEDIGICLGKCFLIALGDKSGITRYGHAYVPLDESLSRVVLDFSGRPGLYYSVGFTRQNVGSFDVDLFREFFQGFVNHSMVTLHIDGLKGTNSHHQAETIFKAFGRSIGIATKRNNFGNDRIPSTKGML